MTDVSQPPEPQPTSAEPGGSDRMVRALVILCVVVGCVIFVASFMMAMLVH